jgi:uncharacterized protein (DUF736 family)
MYAISAPVSHGEGAARKKTGREAQLEYLSVKLDDPSFPAPIYAAWSKPRTETATISTGPAATATEANAQ